MWQLVARGNIQQIGQREQHSPFGLMLLHLGIVITYYLCHCKNKYKLAVLTTEWLPWLQTN